MAVIIKELMNGCDNLDPKFSEEAIGHNALAAGFQGQRQWTDFYPHGAFAAAVLTTSFDWNGAREPYILATENDVLNGLGMMFMKLLTNRAQMFADVRTYWSPEAVKKATGYDLELATENDVLNGLGMMFMKLLTNRAQMFADVRTYWSPEAVKKATGYDLEGVAKENGGFIHLINSGACCLDACGEAKDENGNGVMKEWWNVTEEDQKAIMDATTWNARSRQRILPWRRILLQICYKSRDACYYDSSEPCKRIRTGSSDR